MLKRDFYLSLAYNGDKQGHWAKRHGFRPNNLSALLAGKAKSAHMERNIRAYIADTLPKIAKGLANTA